MLSNFRGLQGKKGFTLIELLIVITIIGILAMIAIPQFSAYKKRAYQADVKANLEDLYWTCKRFWEDNNGTDSCTTDIVSKTAYGWVSLKNVVITITNGTESDFAATATHTLDESSSKSRIDSTGNIT
jgi:type IV pilus assembly protein PilA